MFQRTPVEAGSVVGRLLNQVEYRDPNTDVEMPLIELLTKAVVAICIVLVPAAAVGAVGVPVRAGDARGA